MSKAKENHGKNGKTGNRAEEQDDESTYSLQNYDSRRLLMFLCQGWYSHKEKETLFKHYVRQILVCRRFLVRNLDSVEPRQYLSLSQRKLFPFLTEWYSFFLLWACFFFIFLFFLFLPGTFFRF